MDATSFAGTLMISNRRAEKSDSSSGNGGSSSYGSSVGSGGSYSGSGSSYGSTPSNAGSYFPYSSNSNNMVNDSDKRKLSNMGYNNYRPWSF